MRFKNAVIKFVTTHYIPTLCFIALITGFTFYFYVQIKQGNSVESFYFKDDPILLQYNEFRQKVASDELVVVGFMEKNLYSNKNINLIRKLTEGLSNIKGVQKVHSLTNIHEIVVAGEDISLQKLVPDGTLTKAQLQLIEKKIKSLMGYNRLTTETKDGTAAIIFAEIKTETSKQRMKLADEIIRTTEKITEHRVKLYHSGIPIVFAEMDKMTRKDMLTLVPFVSVIIFVVTLLLFRNFTLTLFAMLTLIITMTWTGGMYVMVGEKATFITSILPAILLALAIADSIHLVSHFLDEIKTGSKDYVETVTITTKEVWMPCLLTTLTTAVGFFSFVTSPLRPVFILGIFASAGVLLAFFIDMTFLPAVLVAFKERILSWVDKKKNNQTEDDHHRVLSILVSKIGNFSTSHTTGLMITFIILIIISVIGMTKLRFESNPLKYLSDDNKIKSDLMFLENNFGGFIPHMVIITSKGDHDFTEPELIKMADTFEEQIRKSYPKHISDSFSIADYVKELNKIFNQNDDNAYTIPDNQLDIIDYYETGSYLRPKIMKRLISRDRREIYITFMGKAGSGTVEEWQEMKSDQMSAALAFFNKKFGDSLSISETGMSELLIQMEENLKTSQMRSMIITSLLILIMMLIMCKNVKLAIIGMLPNVFPIAATLGVMGWLDIPLNETTIMIAAVTLGIAVDDTVHFLTWYIRNSGPDISIKEALLKSFEIVGKPIIITTVLLSTSFFVLILGSFKPVQLYGILTSFSLTTALIADLFFLPALILMFKPKTEKKTNGFTGLVTSSISSTHT